MNFNQVRDAIDSMRVITNEKRMIIIGTQALHGVSPDMPDEIMYSREIDIILSTKASLANWISDVVGDETPFEVDRGYFIDHVRPKPGLPVFADGWESRLIKDDSFTGCDVYFLSPADLAITKLGAGREKDIPFIKGMIDRGVVSCDEIQDLIQLIDEKYQLRVIQSFNSLINEISASRLRL